jgi:hypothetical protein
MLRPSKFRPRDSENSLARRFVTSVKKKEPQGTNARRQFGVAGKERTGNINIEMFATAGRGGIGITPPGRDRLKRPRQQPRKNDSGSGATRIPSRRGSSGRRNGSVGSRGRFRDCRSGDRDG